MKRGKKKSQVWVETVVYTLIFLAILALILAFVRPKIDEYKDRTTIEGTKEALRTMESAINDASLTAGTKKTVDFRLKKGKLILDGSQNKIGFVLEDSKFVASEPGISVIDGGLNMTTTKDRKTTVEIWLELPESIDLKYSGKDERGELQPAAVDYRLIVENLGEDKIEGKVKINIELV